MVQHAAPAAVADAEVGFEHRGLGQLIGVGCPAANQAVKSVGRKVIEEIDLDDYFVAAVSAIAYVAQAVLGFLTEPAFSVSLLFAKLCNATWIIAVAHLFSFHFLVVPPSLPPKGGWNECFRVMASGTKDSCDGHEKS